MVSIVGTCFFDLSKASGIVASAPLACHCFAPAGLFVSSHSFSNRFLKNRLLHFVGVCVQVTSGPPVMASAPMPGAMLALPAEALILERAAFRLRSDQRRIAGAMGLAEGVAAGNQRDGLFVVHRHAEERLADVLGRRERVRIAVRPFRIDVDEAHLHGAERLGELAFAAVAFVAEPGALRTPEQLFGLPDVGAAAGEAERLEAHRFQRDVAGENHQVGPRDLAAVLLLDRPQQPARLVEVGVVRPAVERREALLTGAGAAAAVGDAVGARAVPRHADHQAAIVTEIGRPPFLRIPSSTRAGP